MARVHAGRRLRRPTPALRCPRRGRRIAANPRDLELAAANLGASRVTVLRRITLPLIVANLIAGGLLAFAFAMLEVSDSLILAQRMQYYPITRAILDLSMRLGDGLYIASALGVWAMLLLTLTILAANASARQKDRRSVQGLVIVFRRRCVCRILNRSRIQVIAVPTNAIPTVSATS